MSEIRVINVDLVDVWDGPQRDKLLKTLSWGDRVAVTALNEGSIEIELKKFTEADDGSIVPKFVKGYIVPRKSSGVALSDVLIPKGDNKVLSVNFVDVQQGDGSVIESPAGQVVLIDGGDNQLFARYLAGRFGETTLAEPKSIECILVSHGDADHFVGLPKILESETNKTPRKRLFMQPKRVYHNGIVKRPSKRNNKRVPEKDLLGPTKKVGSDLYIVDLADNLLDVPNEEMNTPFKTWKKTLKTYDKRAPVAFRRLQFGDDNAFDFFADEGISVEILGPLTVDVSGQPGLKFLGEPPKGPRVGHESMEVADLDAKGLSASHTINGHSVIMRLTYGKVSYLFAGDLNDEAGRTLASLHRQGDLSLKADVFKVPHHGSADFSGAFIEAVAPIVSVVSSGDESAKKEYIHPRATLMGALGRLSRVAEPLIFVTELVAFFNVEGWAKLSDAKRSKKRGEFFSFSRTAFGIVKTRTDGQRLLVFTDSGNLAMKEAYAYAIDQSGELQPAPVVHA